MLITVIIGHSSQSSSPRSSPTPGYVLAGFMSPYCFASISQLTDGRVGGSSKIGSEHGGEKDLVLPLRSMISASSLTFLSFVFIFMCACVCVCLPHVFLCAQQPIECVGSPRVKGGCEPPKYVLETELGPSAQTVGLSTFQLSLLHPEPHLFSFWR